MGARVPWVQRLGGHARRPSAESRSVAIEAAAITTPFLAHGEALTTSTMQRASTALGDQRRRIRNRLRSVTRRVLIIGYEALSPKIRAAMVTSYRKLMATTCRPSRHRNDDSSAGSTSPHDQSTGPTDSASRPSGGLAASWAEVADACTTANLGSVAGTSGAAAVKVASVLKRRHGPNRCRYHGKDGMHRWVVSGEHRELLEGVSDRTTKSAKRNDRSPTRPRDRDRPAR
jgi:hypothetical protein